jgi:hypothetical protein
MALAMVLVPAAAAAAAAALIKAQDPGESSLTFRFLLRGCALVMADSRFLSIC